MTHIAPPQYYRRSSQWQQWIGKTGTVELVTTVHVTRQNACGNQPYQVALISFPSNNSKNEPKTKHLFPICVDTTVQKGDHVICVLRKLTDSQENTIVEYGVKCRKKIHFLTSL